MRWEVGALDSSVLVMASWSFWCVSIAGSGRCTGYKWLLILVEVCGIQRLICRLNLEGTNGDEQYDPLPFSSPQIFCEFLSDSGLYIISCQLVRHFTASLEKEEVVNKILD